MERSSKLRSGGMGVIAGIAGGIALGAFFMAMSWKDGHGPLQPLELATYPFLGARLIHTGSAAMAIAVGVLAHLGVSALWGLLFGLAFHGLSRTGTVVAGLVWGFAVWAATFWLVLPLAGMNAVARDLPVLRAIAGELLFGVTLGIAFMPAQPIRMRRRVREERPSVAVTSLETSQTSSLDTST